MNESQPVPRDALGTRAVVLEAATRVFAARGFVGASIGEIAAAAGVSRATPVYFFAHKEGLWRAALDAANRDALEVAPRAFAGLRALGTDPHPEAVVDALVDSFLAFLELQPHFFRLVQWSELQGNAAINDLPSQWAALGLALDTVRNLLAFGKARDQDAAQMVMSIVSLCSAHVVFGQTLGIPLGVEVRDPAFLEARTRHLKHLLRAVLL